MIGEILINILRFFLLLSIQLLVLKNLNISPLLNPFLYILFILSLPAETPKALVMILSIATGLCMDWFSDTVGLHATACLWMGFLRPYMLRVISPREGFDFYYKPNLAYFGFVKYLIYAAPLVVLHHLMLFSLEYFRFAEIGWMLLKTLLSSIFTLTLILITQQFFGGTKKNNQ